MNTSHKNLFIFLFLIILISVSSTSLQINDREENNLIRQRRQTTVPQLIDDLGIFLGQLLHFVSYLLLSLGNALPSILGSLGLGGLGLALDNILTQLAFVVLNISGRKRRGVISIPSFPSLTNAQALQAVKNAITAQKNINNLVTIAQKLNVGGPLNTIVAEINTFSQLLHSGTAAPTAIQNSLNQLLFNLNNIVNPLQLNILSLTSQFQSNLVPIILGLSSPLLYMSGLGPTLSAILTAHGVAAVESVLANIAIAQNATLSSLSNLDSALFSIYNSTVALLQMATTQLGSITSSALA